MWKRLLVDRDNEHIWLTEERWDHVIEGHPEMETLFSEIIETVQKGKKFSFRGDPGKYKYKRRFDHLLPDFNHIVAIVRLHPRKFLITAYAVLEAK